MFRIIRLRTPEITNVDGNIRLVQGLKTVRFERVPTAGWVLVGGASSRMGRDKALVEIDGKPLAAVVASALGEVCGAVHLVGDPARYGGLGLPVIADRMRGSGPLSGIEAALGATTFDWNMIAACDMPALDGPLLRRLLEAAGDDGAVPRYPDGSLEPLCAVYHRRCHSAAAAALESGVRRLSDFIATLTVRYVQVTDARPFLNLNTPGDLENFRRG